MERPDGKFMSTVKVGEKGQIVIPKGARDIFNIKPGDTLLLLADKERGIAIVRNEEFIQFANAIFAAQGKPEEEQE
ncbi:MAG TPA: AbrB family transcriptional regulator [Firmicutes bacterium]|jgi:AbrB family looped-hinge helix DNA binding protein|nr:AbrB family transcriptional regulator [Bacillota bacterium]HAZ21610.1 AbrB family transcriptional regulator [Bacillota bacterium]HBE05016.1 AbrB family transcriptional regulator [Bacillota bacterium]HBG45319.1 AbrB family transcriptional regulator [Bacillota bacterium]HBL50929.1 AbrB family transcriptional regulator [Bacillota bacterium]